MQHLELKLDHPALLARQLADGRSLQAALDALDTERPDLVGELMGRADSWPLKWLELPAGGDWADDCVLLARELAGSCEELIVCGIGGSALGTQAVYAALDWPVASLRPLWVLDNVDPSQVAWLVESADLPRAALSAVSKSGGTLATLAGFFYLLGLLEQQADEGAPAAERVVATTDARRGPLRDLAARRGWMTLDIPADVGGRFIVLSPVGLFPLAFCGVDVLELLRGAQEMQEQCLAGPQRHSPAWQLAALHYLLHTQGGVRETVHYIYGDPLVQLGGWLRQLWAESLAKATTLDGGPGPGCLTPVVARGATDEHSQNQLYLDGPDNKLYGFLSCEQWAADPQIVLPADARAAELALLNERTFGELLSASRRGTRDALIEEGRPVYEISLPSLNAASVGAYLQLWMLATAQAGLLYSVNAFDQPAVDRSKRLTRQYLERG